MISDIWTLEPHGTPGSASTLATHGVTGAILDRPNQAASTLSLTIAAEDVGGVDVSDYTYKSRWVLRRDGDVFFRGRVRSVPRRSGDGSVTIELVDALDDMARTPYLQAWDVVGSDGSIVSQRAPRALLSPSSGRQTTAQCLTTVITAYNEVSTVDLVLSVNLPSLTMPPIEAANLSCLALVRRILEFHPGASAYLVYGASTDTLRIVDRTLASAVSHAVGSRPLADYDLVRRDDLVVDAVHVYYEASATRFATVAGTDGDPDTIRAKRRLAIFADTYPSGSSITDETMVVTLQAPPITDPPAPPIPQMVAIKTRPIPATNATNSAAQKWWLDMLGLSVFGLTADDVFLPSTSAEGQQHRVRFAWAADDPNDPLHQAPSAINPNSTVVWRPAAVTDLPRMLTGGMLAEWMKVDAAELAIDATVYLKKSSVDADAALQKVVVAMLPRVGTLGSEPAYIVDREVRVMGTNAKTKLYKNYAATGSGSPSADTATSLEESRLEAVVPGLAQALYLDRAAATWEGTVPIVEEECGVRQYLGRVLNLNHPSRPEWLTMKALVQRERMDLTRGTTTVTVGPPDHLSPQDRAALWQASRTARAERAQAALAAFSPSSSESDDDLDLPGRTGVFPGTVSPIREVKPTDAEPREKRIPWSLNPTTGANFTVNVGTILKGEESVSQELTCSNPDTEHTAAAGKILAIKIEEEAPTSYSIVLLSSWPEGDGYTVTFTGTLGDDDFEFVARHYPLCRFVDAATEETGISLGEAIYELRLAPREHLSLVYGSYRTPAGEYPVLPGFRTAPRRLTP